MTGYPAAYEVENVEPLTRTEWVDLDALLAQVEAANAREAERPTLPPEDCE